MAADVGRQRSLSVPMSGHLTKLKFGMASSYAPQASLPAHVLVHHPSSSVNCSMHQCTQYVCYMSEKGIGCSFLRAFMHTRSHTCPPHTHSHTRTLLLHRHPTPPTTPPLPHALRCWQTDRHLRWRLFLLGCSLGCGLQQLVPSSIPSRGFVCMLLSLNAAWVVCPS